MSTSSPKILTEEQIKENKRIKLSKDISIGILITILIIIAIYVFVMFEFYKHKGFIFAPYEPVNGDGGPIFYPLGKIIQLTQEQIDHRNEIIRESMSAV